MLEHGPARTRRASVEGTDADAQYRDRLLKHLDAEDYKPKAIDALAAELRVDDVVEFAKAVHELAAEGLVVVDKHGRPLPALQDEDASRHLRGSAKGFGFVETEQAMLGGDIFIPPPPPTPRSGVLSGDTVVVE
ncbi:MAG: hypothetical protein R3B49_07430 [Phycisphaerales bacterium]